MRNLVKRKKRTKNLLIVMFALLITFGVYHTAYIIYELINDNPYIINKQHEKEEKTSKFSLSNDSSHDNVIISGSMQNSNYDNKIINGALGWRNIFPSELICENYNYFYYIEKSYIDFRTDFRAEIFLKCKYSKENYEIELERISKFGSQITSVKKTAVYVDNLLNLPAYVISYNAWSRFSYVLIDEENLSLIYVYLYDVKTMDNIVFDSLYAPSKIIDDSSFPNDLIKRHSYDIFRFD